MRHTREARLSRRRLPWVAATVAMSILLFACGAEDTTADAPDDQATGVEDETEAPDDQAGDDNGEGEDEGTATEPDAGDPEASFAGETLRIVVGFSPGGTFDAIARLLADQLPEHLPGDPPPTVIVQNMPGAASLAAANSVYQLRPSDGRTMVYFHFGTILDSLIGGEGAEFDAFEWDWLGSPAGDFDPGVIYAHDDTGVETVEDLRDHPETIHFGTQNRTAPTTMIVEHLSRVGWPVEMIYGYAGLADVELAFEQGEIDAFSSGAATLFARTDEIRDEINLLFSLGTNQQVEDEGVPNILDVGPDLGLSQEDMDFMNFLVLARAHVHMLALPPGADPARYEALQSAIETILTDPDVMEQVEAIGNIPGYTTPEQIEDTIVQIVEAPQEAVDTYLEYAEESG